VGWWGLCVGWVWLCHRSCVFGGSGGFCWVVWILIYFWLVRLLVFSLTVSASFCVGSEVRGLLAGVVCVLRVYGVLCGCL